METNLLDSVAVGRSLGSVDELISQALRSGLDVAESGGASTRGEEEDGHVHTLHGGHIDGLTTDGTGGTNTFVCSKCVCMNIARCLVCV